MIVIQKTYKVTNIIVVLILHIIFGDYQNNATVNL